MDRVRGCSGTLESIFQGRCYLKNNREGLKYKSGYQQENIGSKPKNALVCKTKLKIKLLLVRMGLAQSFGHIFYNSSLFN